MASPVFERLVGSFTEELHDAEADIELETSP
jgi:hypothetical protein